MSRDNVRRLENNPVGLPNFDDLGKYIRHPVFDRFKCWEGTVPEGLLINFLGATTLESLWSQLFSPLEQYPKNRAERSVKTEYPEFNEEYFEWVDLLEAVASAEGQFVMLELGAGWGRWSANAIAALRQSNDIPYHLVLVEAEPSHFQWMIDHLRANRIDLGRCRLIEAAVAGKDGRVGFNVHSDPVNDYGQTIGGSTEVAAVSLNTLLAPLERIDLIDIDVQGAEFDVLNAAQEALDQKVKRLHVATHSHQIEGALCSLFGRLGWNCLHNFPCQTSIDTEWGTISFQDGVQTWINPAHSQGPEDVISILTGKLQRSRAEGARLWAELDKLRADLDQLRCEITLQRASIAWKLIEKSRRVRDRMIPMGSRRRMTYDFIVNRMHKFW